MATSSEPDQDCNLSQFLREVSSESRLLVKITTAGHLDVGPFRLLVGAESLPDVLAEASSDDDLASHNSLVRWFQKVIAPTKPSTSCFDQ